MSISSAPSFAGNSQFAQDLQSAIDRQVAIASLPMQLMQNTLNALTNQSTDLNGLDTKFAALQTALQNLATASTAPAASSSDPTIVNAAAGSGAAEGTYTVEVVTLGSYSSSMSKAGLAKVSDPSTQNITTASSFTLTINGVATTITPTSNTLNSLVQAINALPNSTVRASIVNVGPPSAPDYRLTLQSTKLSPDTIDLSDTSGSLVDALATGANGSYKVNGITTAISTDSRSILLAPGVTAQLVGTSTPGQATTVTVSTNSSALKNALSAVADAYNAIVSSLDSEYGQNPGALAGQSIVSSLSNILRGISGYSTTAGSVGSLAQIGLEVDAQGKLSFNATTFDNAMAANSGAVMTFLGDSTSGFLQSANNSLDTVEDSTSGTLKTAITDVKNQITAENKSIQDQQDRIDVLKQQLQAQMAAADALIASLQSQATYMTNLVQSMIFNNSNPNGNKG